MTALPTAPARPGRRPVPVIGHDGTPFPSVSAAIDAYRTHPAYFYEVADRVGACWVLAEAPRPRRGKETPDLPGPPRWIGHDALMERAQAGGRVWVEVSK